jgi:hypothetical protein
MKNFVKFGSAVGVAAVLLTACEPNDINSKNPNQFSDAAPELMITGAQLANVMVQEGELARMGGIFAGYFTGSDRQYISVGQYNVVAGDLDNIWGTLYAEGIAQSRIIQTKAEAKNDMVLKGIAQVNEAQLLMTAAALWGNVPNTEACDVDNFPNPSYDGQADVYQAAIDLLDDAIANGVGGSTKYRAAYAGSFDWEEVANTLKARAYLHLGNYTAAKAAALAGITEGNDMYALHNAGYTPGKHNLFYDFLDWNRGGYMSCAGSHIEKLMDANSTSYRGNAKTDETERFNYYFFPGGYTALDPNWDDASYGDHYGIFASDNNYLLVSYVENQLILAECYAREDNLTDALAALNSVRAAHDGQFGGFDAYDATDFGPGALIAGATAKEAMMKEILTEKYVSMFGHLEGFNDVRRTGNALGITPYIGAELPQRMIYPQSEINANANVPTPQPGTFVKTPIWQ